MCVCVFSQGFIWAESHQSLCSCLILLFLNSREKFFPINLWNTPSKTIPSNRWLPLSHHGVMSCSHRRHAQRSSNLITKSDFNYNLEESSLISSFVVSWAAVESTRKCLWVHFDTYVYFRNLYILIQLMFISQKYSSIRDTKAILDEYRCTAFTFLYGNYLFLLLLERNMDCDTHGSQSSQSLPSLPTKYELSLACTLHIPACLSKLTSLSAS